MCVSVTPAPVRQTGPHPLQSKERPAGPMWRRLSHSLAVSSLQRSVNRFRQRKTDRLRIGALLELQRTALQPLDLIALRQGRRHAMVRNEPQQLVLYHLAE